MPDVHDHVLLVEDDASLAGLHAMALEGEGYVVTVAPDGLAALELARLHEPDLIVLDVGLPKLDGLGVLAELRAGRLTQDIPVLVFSNCDDPETIRRAFELGATDYLVKSDTPPGQLAQHVKRVVGGADDKSRLPIRRGWRLPRRR